MFGCVLWNLACLTSLIVVSSQFVAVFSPKRLTRNSRRFGAASFSLLLFGGHRTLRERISTICCAGDKSKSVKGESGVAKVQADDLCFTFALVLALRFGAVFLAP